MLGRCPPAVSARVPSSADSGEQLGTRVQQTWTGHSQPVALDLEHAEGGGLLDEASVDAGQGSSSSAKVT
jgi:hypothetical protein